MAAIRTLSSQSRGHLERLAGGVADLAQIARLLRYRGGQRRRGRAVAGAESGRTRLPEWPSSAIAASTAANGQ